MTLYPSIGLEIHVELDTESKMFCSCKNDSDEQSPNKNICPICLGHPGTLPVANEKAIRYVLKLGIALGCEILQETYFDRKSYFYPDLPKGYQISQHFAPFCKNGFLKIGEIKIKIREVHLEEDTCKLIHPGGSDYSLVDCNRAGVPLMELVTAPDIRSAREAKDFAYELYLILHYLGISNADMEKGQMRIEANISLSEKEGELGEKVELKNINSFRSVERAIEYEIERQKAKLEKGEKIVQQTRGWDDNKGKTLAQRTKETSKDYRYFPEPDLPLLEITTSYLREIKSEIPELPFEKRERMEKEYYLSKERADFLVVQKSLGEFFEKVVSEFPSRLEHNKLKEFIMLAFNYLTTDLQALLKEGGIGVKDAKITAENFADLIELVYQKKISSKIAKKVLGIMFETGADPDHIIKDKGLGKMEDRGGLEAAVEEILKKNKKAVSDYRLGKEEALKFLVGQVMARTRGRADPQKAEEVLRRKLAL